MYNHIEIKHKPILRNQSLSMPPENIREPETSIHFVSFYSSGFLIDIGGIDLHLGKRPVT